MAIVDTYIPFNMLNGFNFSQLLYADYVYGDSGWLTAGHPDGTNDTLWGYGFAYDDFGIPTGEGTVTGYSFFMNWSNDLVVDVSGIEVPAGLVMEAALTPSLADDIAIVRGVLAGADTVYGSDYADVLDGFGGNDSIYAYAGNDTVYGEAGNDGLNGMDGNDHIDGGAGADIMAGNYGNDVFMVDNAGDRIFEVAGQGTDTAYASVSFKLAAGQSVETLAAASAGATTAINLTGNELVQALVGNNGANVLSAAGGNDTVKGLGGNDVIFGGAGNDTLTGGAGSDYFVFNTALSATTNVDRITDFNVAQDTIRVDNSVMAGLGAHVGTLSAGMFWKSTSGLAHDAGDRIVYETDTGWLNYDSNGSAAGGLVHFAKLAPNLALTNSDFAVI